LITILILEKPCSTQMVLRIRNKLETILTKGHIFKRDAIGWARRAEEQRQEAVRGKATAESKYR